MELRRHKVLARATCSSAQRTMSAAFVAVISIMCCVAIFGMAAVTAQDMPEEMEKPPRVSLSDPNNQPKGSFMDLATERFLARRPVGQAVADIARGEAWTFDHVQLVRVPKAASTAASKLARKLVGCTPEGPCCNYPGDPPGSCPARGLMCPKVTGCVGHRVGNKEKHMISDPKVFSMSNIRDVADRIVSGFFYTPPHSPPCAREPGVDVAECFLSMLKTPKFQNVASRMISGHTAYDQTKVICKSRPTAKHHEDGWYQGRCVADLEDAIAGACGLNFITMCEAWGSSMLLLFETLPWLEPAAKDFPAVRNADSGEALHDRENTGKRHEEGIGQISESLKEQARESSAVDEALHEFVSAKFCGRLHEYGLVDHPAVSSELTLNERFGMRCNNSSWIASTLERFEPLTPSDCRLYRPLAYGDASS